MQRQDEQEAAGLTNAEVVAEQLAPGGDAYGDEEEEEA
jgi:hypothetical protein